MESEFRTTRLPTLPARTPPRRPLKLPVKAPLKYLPVSSPLVPIIYVPIDERARERATAGAV